MPRMMQRYGTSFADARLVTPLPRVALNSDVINQPMSDDISAAAALRVHSIIRGVVLLIIGKET